jgi:hypothetical protein
VAIKPSAFLQKLARDNTNLLGETHHSMAVIRFGACIAKISAAPPSAKVKARTGKRIEEVGDTTMRDLVVEHFRREGAEYQLRAQLCVDLKQMPVEMRPYFGARNCRYISLSPRCASRRKMRFHRLVASLATFSRLPRGTGIEEHRPLGAIMRVRKAVYEQSNLFATRSTRRMCSHASSQRRSASFRTERRVRDC